MEHIDALTFNKALTDVSVQTQMTGPTLNQMMVVDTMQTLHLRVTVHSL